MGVVVVARAECWAVEVEREGGRAAVAMVVEATAVEEMVEGDRVAVRVGSGKARVAEKAAEKATSSKLGMRREASVCKDRRTTLN